MGSIGLTLLRPHHQHSLLPASPPHLILSPLSINSHYAPPPPPPPPTTTTTTMRVMSIIISIYPPSLHRAKTWIDWLSTYSLISSNPSQTFPPPSSIHPSTPHHPLLHHSLPPSSLASTVPSVAVQLVGISSPLTSIDSYSGLPPIFSRCSITPNPNPHLPPNPISPALLRPSRMKSSSGHGPPSYSNVPSYYPLAESINRNDGS